MIVRYDYDRLPAPAQVYLTSQAWDGYHAFVMYAHLQQILVGQGAALMPGKQIGTRGSSGNSSGPHLHLELRFRKHPTSSWDSIRSGLANPSVLFSR